MRVKLYKEGLKKAKQDFLKIYPNANLKKFGFDVDIEDGKITKTSVLYKYDVDGDSYDISSRTFWAKPSWEKDLNLTFKQKVYLRYFGYKKFVRAQNIIREAKEKLKRDFLTKYPDADLDKFDFNVELDRNTLKVKNTYIEYKASKNISYDITSDTFKKNYQDEFYWTPRMWGPRGSVSSLKMASNSLPYNVTTFDIYVTAEGRYFETNFKPLNTTWENKTNSKDITKVLFDREDPYFASLMAAYIISYKTGFSREHITASQPDIITSIAKYFVYYHMRRYLRDPSKIFLTNDEIALVQMNIPTKKKWKDKFVNTKEIPVLWYNKQHNKRNIRNYHAEYYSGGGGQMGIKYQEAEEITSGSDTDWMCFIKEDADGFTSFGQKLLQQAIESYVYCVLSAQAQTRWAIAGSGAKSIQTQDVFFRLVKDTIAEDSTTTIISNMRKAISSTNVVLNMVISPGVILIPSDMIIIKKKIPGFNNTLTLATSSMKFGVNEDVNKVKEEITAKQDQTTVKEDQTTVKEETKQSLQFVEYIAGGAIISVVTKIILRLL